MTNSRATPQISEAQFVQDIDNFEGVKNIRNYCISSIRDDGYEFGEESVGVLQIFNKTNEDKKIDKNDIARIQCLSRFVGALAIKAREVTSSLTLMIGMNINIGRTMEEMASVHRS